MENSETAWPDFALKCEYIDESDHRCLIQMNTEAGRLLAHKINNPAKYTGSVRKTG
jgi:hypothetical protein